MKKLFEWIKQGAGRRVLQLTVLQNGKFEACVIEGGNAYGVGNTVAKHTASTGDAALVGVAIGILNLAGVKLAGDGKDRI